VTKVLATADRQPQRQARAAHHREGMTSEEVVRDAMSAPVAVVRDRDSTRRAIVRFTETGLRHLVVLDDADNLVGVLDDRRVLALWPLDAVSLHRVTVGELVRTRSAGPDAPLRVNHTAPLSTAAALMLGRAVDALPVVDDRGAVVGIITGSDLVRALVRTAVVDDEELGSVVSES
jgi:acetoin utilization protein AcuB